MTFESGAPRAFLNFFKRAADVDRQAQIRRSQVPYESDNGIGIVKNGGNRRWARHPLDHGFEVARQLSVPVHEGIQALRGPKQSAMARVAHIHGVVLSSDLQKALLLFNRTFVIDAAGGNRKDDVVVFEALAGTVSMKCIRHLCTTSPTS